MLQTELLDRQPRHDISSTQDRLALAVGSFANSVGGGGHFEAGEQMINSDELAICKRRGHNIALVLDKKWSPCDSCGTWVRRVPVAQEREDEPSEDEIHPRITLQRRLEKAHGHEMSRERKRSTRTNWLSAGGVAIIYVASVLMRGGVSANPARYGYARYMLPRSVRTNHLRKKSTLS